MSIAVKTCGLSDRRAVDAALAGGARFLGFVFFPPSPRDVAPGRAAALSAGLQEGVATVGVVVEPDDEFLDGVLSEVRLDYIQLHGNESPARAEAIRARTGCGIIKAISVSQASDIARADDYGESADLILFDVDDGEISSLKVASTPKEPLRAFISSIEEMVSRTSAFSLSSGISTS